LNWVSPFSSNKTKSIKIHIDPLQKQKKMKAFLVSVSIAVTLVSAKVEWQFECSPSYCLKLSDFTLGTPGKFLDIL
jgi:hypothetical protein